MRLVDLTGKRVGKLTVIQRHYDPNKKHTLWECKCNCGNMSIVSAYRLIHGLTKSCGCLRSEVTTKKNTTHGMSKTPLYNVWNSMRKRCYNENDKNYPSYGGRGIEVCPEWKDEFNEFQKWALSNGYCIGLTLDRIDNNGDYCAQNCRWVDTKTQNDNRRVSFLVTYNGETKPLHIWCEDLGLPYMRIWQRIKRYGCSFEEAITLPNYLQNKRKKKESE